ncbi:SusC/RagA family TonB-linked outer membrane protein [Sphingobacterium sp.]|uniref:Outer membrane protein n=1 Tax=Sphingobacterium sp. enrichment culture clone GIN723 TaxID=1353894 RepID=S4Z9K2_9SPHI|nr:SusC/RagA family TonB-linked outer membrane protein [Sphingobacterium sp.]AGP51343.1 outer membrane protein [Sphingobacterium sp. enrichment culture clone GIN723]
MKHKLLSFFVGSMILTSVAFAQEKKVSGRVTGADGKPLAGVTIAVQGSNVATQTDANGNYSLSVPTGKVIVFRSVGFADKTLIVKEGQSAFNVTLDNSDNALEEVVVTALGISKSSRGIGYSTSKVSGDDLVKSGEANIIQGLAAKASGVQITSSAGTPGASSKIVLRGAATFSGDNQPLIVVDGVPIDNDMNFVKAGDDPYNQNLAGVQLGNRALDINPDDIETVTILKGPAAAALYGQAAGNGAIIYTTKKGKLGSGLGVTFSSGFELQKVNKLPDLQNKYGQGTGGVFSSSTADSWGENLANVGKPSYNNVEDFFQNGSVFTNNLAITSGGDKTTMRFSVGSTNNKGIVPNSNFNRYTSRLSSETKLNDNITVGGNFSFTNSNTRAAQNGSNLAGVMLSLLRSPVDFNLADYKNEDGSQKQYFASYDNPYWSTENNPYKEENTRFLGNIYTDIRLNNTFSLSWKTGLDTYSTNGTQIYAIGSIGDDNNSGLGEIKRSNVNYKNVYSDLLLKFKHNISEDFSVSGLLGGNFNYTQALTNFARGRELSMPGYYNFASAKDLYASNSESYKNSRAIFLDATFDYRSILFLTLTGRNEWSTTFGRDSKGFFYPKADISYIFSDLFKESPIVSFGKIRLAYSNVGISPSVYSDRAYYTVPTIADGMTNGFSFPYLGQTGFAISSVAVAKSFKPERNVGYEAGLEMKFLQNRLGFDFTYYQQKSSDLLLSQPIDPTTGYANYYNNIGKIKNTGVELSVNGHIVKSENFNWNATVNWSKNNNEVYELAEGVEKLSIGSAFSSPQSYAIVGQPFGVIYAQKFQRNDQGQVLIDPNSGLPLYEAELGSVGSTIPKWLMNFNNEFSYKNLSFSFLWDFRKGGKIWGGTNANLINRGKAEITADRERNYVVDGVYASGTNAGKQNTTEIPATTYFRNYLGNSSSEIAIQDGSWARLRSVDLSYRFNKVSKAIQYIQVGLNLRNPILITKYKGIDPETSLTGSNQNFTGYDFFNNPGTKSYSFNLRVGF